jgi:hypothetical protein
MTRVTAFSGALLLVALTVGCSKPKPAAGPASGLLVALIPADSVALAGGRLEPLRKADLLPPFAELEGKTGFNPATDVDEFLFAYNGQSGCLLVEGRFDLETLKKAGASRQTVAGREVWSMEAGAMVFVSNRVAVMGPPALVKTSIEGKTAPGSKLTELLRGIPADAALWAVSLGQLRVPVPERSNLANIEKILSEVETVTAYAKVGSGVDFAALAVSADDASARKLHDAVRGLLGLARLSTPTQQTELLAVYDAINVRHQGKETRVSGYLTRSQIDQVRALMPRR